MHLNIIRLSVEMRCLHVPMGNVVTVINMSLIYSYSFNM